MKSYNNEMEISRNETFSIDKIIRRQDGSPFIVSNELYNPYFLVSVSSTTYEQKDRKVYNKWLNLKDFPKFTETVPINLKSLLNVPNGVPQYESFDDITDIIEVEGVPNIIAHGFIGNKHIFYEPQDAVFYIEDENGERIYKYWSTEGWKDYTCRIVTSYDISVTSQWIGQNYVYSITLVSGLTTREYLVSLANDNDIYVDDTITNEELYNQLVDKGVTFVETFKLDRELALFDTYKPLLKPKKLTVSSNILGGL